MTNIEAMTIGAQARLQHLLDKNVAMHKAEMRQHSDLYRIMNFTGIVQLEPSLEQKISRFSGPGMTPPGTFLITDGYSAQWVRPINKQEAV